MALSYTNRLGRCYTLHAYPTARGKQRWSLATRPGPEAQDALPEGWEMGELASGRVFVRRRRTEGPSEPQRQRLLALLAACGLDDCLVERRVDRLRLLRASLRGADLSAALVPLLGPADAAALRGALLARVPYELRAELQPAPGTPEIFVLRRVAAPAPAAPELRGDFETLGRAAADWLAEH